MWTISVKNVLRSRQRLLPLNSTRILHCNKSTVAFPEEDLKGVNALDASQTSMGKIYDKKPFKFRCIEGETYMWCACGNSKSQPFCDYLCKNTHFKITMHPVKFICQKTKVYWFCNCKQTSKRPFCDGTHRREDIIAAVRV